MTVGICKQAAEASYGVACLARRRLKTQPQQKRVNAWQKASIVQKDSYYMCETLLDNGLMNIKMLTPEAMDVVNTASRKAHRF